MKKALLVFYFLMSFVAVHAQNCAFTSGTSGGGMYYFVADSTFDPNTTQYYWTISNGVSMTGFMPSAVLTPGAYGICVDYFDSTGVQLCSYCDSIVVAGPSCIFNVYQTPGSLLVDFMTQVPAGQYAAWSYGDGTSGLGSSPYHTYSNGGNYTVCVQHIDSMSQVVVCSSCQTITLQGGTTTCSFTAAPDSMNPMTYSFFANPAAGNSYIGWSFGDSAIASGLSAAHTYTASGVYVACMNEYDANGTLLCSSCQSIYISPGGACGINAVNLQGSTYLFQVAIPQAGAQIDWDFGDGSIGNGSNVYHSFNSAGIFNVCVTQTDANGLVVCTNCTTVVDSFMTSNCNVTFAPLGTNNFQFTVSGNPSASGYNWDFGDGSNGSGMNPQHYFAMAGVYNVCVSVVGGGAVLCTSCVTVVVSNTAPSCAAYYMASVQAMDAYFIDLSNGTSPATTYMWDFGDGSMSSIRFPQHTYTQPGVYTVCLTIADSACSNTYCSMVIADSMVVVPSGCQASFATLQLAPYQLAVINFSSGTNLNFSWDFGDGSTANQPYPSHVYASTGAYYLCLTVSDNNGCSDTFCDTVAVDSSGNIFRSLTGFTISVLSPSMIAGVNDAPENVRFTAYPNPVSDMLSIKRNANGSASYRIINLQGAVVNAGLLQDESTPIDVSTMARGSYLLEVTESTGYRSHRMLIKN